MASRSARTTRRYSGSTGAQFREVFDAVPAALRALRDFRASGGDPPWGHAAALLAEGLIDVDFGLSARGRRAPVEARGG